MKWAVKRVFLFVQALLLLCLVGFPSSGQAAKESGAVQVKAHLSHESIRPGESFQVALVATIKPGLHINSHQPTDAFLVPTVFEFDETKGIIFSPVSYPKPRFKAFSFSKKKLSVYENKVAFFARGRLTEDVAEDTLVVSGILNYQACNDRSCFMPDSVKFKIPVKVVSSNEPVKLTDDKIFQEEASLSPEEHRAKEVIEKGIVYALAAFFLFGLALNLTPCVYPVIPITVAFFGAQGEKTKSRTFVLALYYVVGIALVFSILGLVSSLAGRQWGFMFQSPWFVIVITMIILAMAASMFGAFEIRAPASLMTYGSKSRQGAVGSFIMGLTVGVIIAPCAAGIIIGLIGIVAKLGMVGKGTLLFFFMGLGLGLPFLFLAVFSGLMNRLPKSGMWMVWIRKLFGVLLIGVALYFLIPQGKQAHDQQGFYLGVLGIFGGLLLGFLESSEGYGRAFKTVRAVVGSLLIIAGGFLVNHALHAKAEAINWVAYTNQSLEQLRKNDKPILIDFYADWCAACRELDDKTFSDAAVADTAKAFLMVKADLTTPDTASQALLKKFKVSGLPSVAFVSVDGTQLDDLRIVGFVSPTEMLKRMEATLAH